jgi:hypothetical protein
MFILKDTEPSPLQDSSGVHQKGDLLGIPPRSPQPRIHRCPGSQPKLYCPGWARIILWLGFLLVNRGPGSPLGTAAAAAECPGEDPRAMPQQHSLRLGVQMSSVYGPLGSRGSYVDFGRFPTLKSVSDPCPLW